MVPNGVMMPEQLFGTGYWEFLLGQCYLILCKLFFNNYQKNPGMQRITLQIAYSESRHNPKTQLSYATLPK